MIDRYEVGERQTSACAAPTEWLEHLELIGLRAADVLGPRHPRARADAAVALAVDVLDVRLPPHLRAAARAGRRLVRVRDGEGQRRTGFTVHTDRRRPQRAFDRRRPGWRRILGAGPTCSRRTRGCSRGPGGPPHSGGDDLELWIDPRYVQSAATRGRFRPDGELRVGVGSFDPRDHVKEPTLQLAADVGVPAERWQATGSRTSCARRPRTASSSRRQRRSLPADDRRGHPPAFYFGLALGRELARRPRRPPDARAGSGALRRLLARSPVVLPLDVAASSTSSAGSRRRACWPLGCG